MQKVFLRLCTVLVLIGLVVGMTISVSANEPTSGKWGDLSWTLDKVTGLLTISGSGEMDGFEDNPTGAWKAHKDSIKKVKVEEGITRIGNEAFDSFLNLKSVRLPSSLKSIGDGAFSNCSKLTDLEIPSGVEKVGTSAFSSCTGLIQIENGLSYVGKWVISSDSDSGRVVDWRTDTIGIGDSAFRGRPRLTSVNLPSGLKYIGDLAFVRCENLMNISIPKSVTHIGMFAFNHCTSLTEIKIPSSVISIGEYAFSECSGLEQFSIPSGITEISHGLFSDCSGLKSIEIPDGITSIGNCAFEYCESLTSVKIPSSVKSIGERAFSYCDVLTDVWYAGCRGSWETVAVDESNNYQFNSIEFGNIHPYGDWVQFDNTQHKRVCVCGEEEYADHTYGEWVVVSEATEDAEGLREKVCICGHKIQENTLMIPNWTKKVYCFSVTGNGVAMIALMGISAGIFTVKKKKSEDEE